MKALYKHLLLRVQTPNTRNITGSVIKDLYLDLLDLRSNTAWKPYRKNKAESSRESFVLLPLNLHPEKCIIRNCKVPLYRAANKIIILIIELIDVAVRYRWTDSIPSSSRCTSFFFVGIQVFVIDFCGTESDSNCYEGTELFAELLNMHFSKACYLKIFWRMLWMSENQGKYYRFNKGIYMFSSFINWSFISAWIYTCYLKRISGDSYTKFATPKREQIISC